MTARDSFLRDVEIERDKYFSSPDRLKRFREVIEALSSPETLQLDFALRAALVSCAAIAWRIARDRGIEDEIPF